MVSWHYDAERRRLERVIESPADRASKLGGTIVVTAVYAAPGADTSDLPRGVAVHALDPAVAALLADPERAAEFTANRTTFARRAATALTQSRPGRRRARSA